MTVEQCCNDSDGRRPKYAEKTFPNATVSTKVPTNTGFDRTLVSGAENQ